MPNAPALLRANQIGCGGGAAAIQRSLVCSSVRYAAFFVRNRRTARGHYEVEFLPLAAAGERLESGEFTSRFAGMVEEQIRSAPADWPWSHKRWKLKKPLYGN